MIRSSTISCEYLQACHDIDFRFYASQGYEDELCKIRKEREDERKTRITELKDESCQVK